MGKGGWGLRILKSLMARVKGANFCGILGLGRGVYPFKSVVMGLE